MEFLRNAFTNFIFENFFSHEVLMTERVTSIGNNLYEQSNAAS